MCVPIRVYSSCYKRETLTWQNFNHRLYYDLKRSCLKILLIFCFLNLPKYSLFIFIFVGTLAVSGVQFNHAIWETVTLHTRTPQQNNNSLRLRKKQQTCFTYFFFINCFFLCSKTIVWIKKDGNIVENDNNLKNEEVPS